MARKRTILLVPPDGSPGHGLRIRPSLLIAACCILTLGVAGYFIPFHIFTLDLVEQNQEKNLSAQNKALLERILMTLKTVNILRSQITELEAQRASIASSLKSSALLMEAPSQRDKPKYAAAATLSLEQLLTMAGASERFFQSLIAEAGSKSSPFDTLPVLRPVKGDVLVSAGFGKQRDPFTGLEKWHYGMDFAAPQETPVIATASGLVETIDEDRQWGKRIVIRHCSTYTTVYSHLGTISVGWGAKVKRGDCIASVGISGLTRGPHLHYEIHKNGTPVNPVDFFFPESLGTPSAVAAR
jgi:murein DD-endopeptidase MepM/ murein hydrolase activator NlpD